MVEENQTQEQPKNTVALIGMIFSIIGLVLFITVIFGRLGLPLLVLGFILGIIGLFYKPRGKAWIAVCIPLIVFLSIGLLISHIRNSAKTPAKEFMNWSEANLEKLSEEDFDEDRFEYIFESEMNNFVNEKTSDEWKLAYESSTGSNAIERASYLFFSSLQQIFETSLEKYNNNELPEINNNNIIDVDIDINSEENDEDETEVTESNKETVEVFSESEKNDIEQIIDLLE